MGVVTSEKVCVVVWSIAANDDSFMSMCCQSENSALGAFWVQVLSQVQVGLLSPVKAMISQSLT